MNIYLTNLFLGIALAAGCMNSQNHRSNAVTDSPAPTPPATAEVEFARNPKPEPFAVLELFTSEGCSSCPPAYEVMERTMKRAQAGEKRVFLLDFHVDYWNNAQWTDPYSNADNTQRQKRYGKQFPASGLYTPQLVVNGAREVVGADEVKVHRAVKTALDSNYTYSLKITRVGSASPDSLLVSYQANAIPENGMLNLALVQHTATMAVKGGENAGRTLTHHNVVRSFISLPVSDRSGTVTVSKKELPEGEAYSVIAYLQNPATMQIFSADSQTPALKARRQ